MPAPPAIGTTFPATRAGVAEALGALGYSPDLVAAGLFRAGHLGAPGEARQCPIAGYLHAVLRPRWPVSVGEARATVFANGARFDVALPDPVRRFVAAFDLGGYAFLHPAGYVDPDAPRDPLARSVPAPAGDIW